MIEEQALPATQQEKEKGQEEEMGKEEEQEQERGQQEQQEITLPPPRRTKRISKPAQLAPGMVYYF